MKKQLIALTAAVLLLLPTTGCETFQVQRYVPISFTSADQDQITAGLIGKEYLEYKTEDGSIDKSDIDTVAAWTRDGSTWDTYSTIVGKDGHEGYVEYVSDDDSLTTGQRGVRFAEVQAWYLNIDARLGAPEWTE